MITNSCSLLITLTIILHHGTRAIDPGTSITMSGQTISTQALIYQIEKALRKHDFSAEQRFGHQIFNRWDSSCMESSWYVKADEYQAWPAWHKGECDDLTRATQQWRFDGRALKTGSREQFPHLQGDACLDCYRHQENCQLYVYTCNGASNQNFFLRIHPTHVTPIINSDKIYFAIHSEWNPSQCVTRGYDYRDYGVFRLEECTGKPEQSFYLQNICQNDRAIKRELQLVKKRLVDASEPKHYSVDVSFSLEDYYKSGKLIHIKNLPDSCFGVDPSGKFGSQEINGQSYYSTRALSCDDAKDSGQLWRLMNRRTRLELGSKVDNFPDLSGNFPCLECVGEDQDCSLYIGSCMEKRENQDFEIREANVVSNSSAYFSIHSRKYPNSCISTYTV